MPPRRPCRSSATPRARTTTHPSGRRREDPCSFLADPLDFPFEGDVGFCLDPAPHFLAQCLDLRTRRATEVEQEVAMFFRDLGVAHSKAAAAGRVDQRPGLMTGRVLEGRAAGAA